VPFEFSDPLPPDPVVPEKSLSAELIAAAVMPVISAELPKPAAPARVAGDVLAGESETGWLVFLGLVLLAAALAFAGAWIRATPGTAAAPAPNSAQGMLVIPGQHD
jgi:hypothetical protein